MQLNLTLIIFMYFMQRAIHSHKSAQNIENQQTSYECLATDNIKTIYLLGGADNEGESTAFSMFDVVENKWTIGPSMNIARYLSACIYVNQQIFIFGGQFQNNSVEMIDFSVSMDNEWKLLPGINSSVFNQYPYYYNAFYPAMNVITGDDWKSNTIFIFGG